jgi:hypothetical protein
MNKIPQITNSRWIWYEFRYRSVDIMLPNRYRLVTNNSYLLRERKVKLLFTRIACSATTRSGVDDAIQVNKSGLTLECCIWFCSIPYCSFNLVVGRKILLDIMSD